MDNSTRRKLLLLSILLGIEPVTLDPKNAAWSTIHGWQTRLAQKLDVKANAITAWIRRDQIPPARTQEIEDSFNLPRGKWHREKLTDQHIYNAALTGDPDAAHHPEARHEQPRAESQEYPSNKSSPGAEPETPIRVADALTRTARILESGTSYGRALFHNILSFDRALEAEQKLDALAEDNERLTRRLEEIESKQAEANRDLNRRLAALEESSAGRGKRQGRA